MARGDYKKVSSQAIGTYAKPLGRMSNLRRFYDGSPGRVLVVCPDCGHDADLAMGGDHGGDCVPGTTR